MLSLLAQYDPNNIAHHTSDTAIWVAILVGIGLLASTGLLLILEFSTRGTLREMKDDIKTLFGRLDGRQCEVHRLDLENIKRGCAECRQALTGRLDRYETRLLELEHPARREKPE